MSQMSVHTAKPMVQVSAPTDTQKSATTLAPPSSPPVPSVKAAPPTGFQQRSDVSLPSQLVAPEVASTVKKGAEKLGSDTLSSNSEQLADVHAMITDVVPSVPSSSPSKPPSQPPSVSSVVTEPSPALPDSVISPKHFKIIEDMARAGKSPDEIAKFLKDPDKNQGATGADRYNLADSPNKASTEQLAAKIKETPQFQRGESMALAAKKNPAEVRGPLMRAADRLPAEAAAIKKQLQDPKLTPEQRKTLEGKLRTAESGMKYSPEWVESRQTELTQLKGQLRKAQGMFPDLAKAVASLPEKEQQLARLEKLLENPDRRKEFSLMSVQDVKNQIVALQKEVTPLRNVAALQKKIAGIENELKQSATIPAAGPTPLKSDMLHRSNNIFQKIYNQAVEHQSHGGEHGEHGEMQWSKVKREFLESSDRQEFSMRAVSDFREQFVLLTFKEVASEMRATEVGKLKTELQGLTEPAAIDAKKKEIKEVEASWDRLDKRAVGSTDLTSDFDMTVLADRAGIDTQIMKEVNKRIGEKYGKEAGSVFDTNLYVKGGGGPEVDKEIQDQKPREWTNKVAHAAHDEGMDIASLVKQRKYSSPEQWSQFTQKLSLGLTARLRAANPDMSVGEISKMVNQQMSRYTQADQLYRASETAIAEKMAELKNKPGNEHLSKFDLGVAAMNRLFEESSEKADVIKKAWEKMPESTAEERSAKDAKWAEYTRADSHAQLFANEPYFSEGPIRDVVINGQKLKGLKEVKGEDGVVRQLFQPDTKGGKIQKVDISPVQALESLTENFGDAMKEFEHLKGQPMGDIAIKASKYMGRLTRAIQAGIPEGSMPPSMKTMIANLQGAEVELLRIRKGGKLPDGFVGSKQDYAMKVLADNHLGDITSLPKLEACFRDLKMDAEIEIRSTMAAAR